MLAIPPAHPAMYMNTERRLPASLDHALLEGSSDGVVVVGRDGRIQSANSKACALARSTEPEMIGSPIERYVDSGQRTRLGECFDTLRADLDVDTVLSLEAQGRRGHVEVRARRMADGRVLVLLRDMHELRRQERALRVVSEVLAEAHGQAFFGSLARALREVLGADVALVAEAASGDADDVLVHALAHEGGVQSGARLPVAGTAFRTALRDGVPLRYATDGSELVGTGLESTLGPAAGLVVPLTDSGGRAVGLMGVLGRDDACLDPAAIATLDLVAARAAAEIARARAETALRRSERHLKAMVQASARFVWSIDAEGNPTLHAERTWAHVSGQEIAPDEDGSRWLQAVVPQDRERVAAEWSAAFEARREHELRYRVQAPDGSVRHLHVRGVPVFDDDQHFEGFIGTLEDVTELRRAAEKLELRNRALQVLRAVPEAGNRGADFLECVSVALSENCRTWGFDRGFAHLLERPGGSFRRARVRFPDDAVWGHEPTRQSGSMESDLLTRLGDADDVSWGDDETDVLVPVRLGGELVAVLHFESDEGRPGEDTVAEVLAQVALQLARAYDRQRQADEALQARRIAFEGQKLEAVGRLAGGVAHEFNNRLMVVLGEAGLALRDPGLSASVRAALEQIQASGRRAGAVVRRLLLFAEREASDAEPIDLCAVVTELRRAAQGVLGENHEIQTHVAAAGSDCGARIDRGLIEQALLNMVTNAAEAMPEGGRIAVRVGSAEVTGTRAARHGVADGRYVVVSVGDEGTGIPPEHLESVFEPFFTTKPEHTGLGLASAYGYVAAAGGFLEVESEVGLGAELRLYLPTTPLDGHESPPRESAWLVEDDARVRAITKLILSEAGYAVEAFECKADVERALREGDEAPDVLVTDWTLPDGTGDEVDALVREWAEGIGTVIVSGHPEASLPRTRPSAPDRVFVEKPFEVKALVAAVRRAGAEARNTVEPDERSADPVEPSPEQLPNGAMRHR